MNRIHKEENFVSYLHDKDEPVKIPIGTGQLRIEELHILPEGDLDNNPVYVFKMFNDHGQEYITQISKRMFDEGIKKFIKLKE